MRIGGLSGETKLSEMNNWYYYNPKPKVFVRYAVKGVFECDECKKVKTIGDIVKVCIDREETPQDNGDVIIKNTWLKHKLHKKSDIECPCEKGTLVFQGYPVRIEKVKKEGKVKSIGIFNMIEGRIIDTKWHWFKTKKRQLAFAEKHGTKK